MTLDLTPLNELIERQNKLCETTEFLGYKNALTEDQIHLSLLTTLKVMAEALGTCNAELSAMNKTIGWRDGEWASVMESNKALSDFTSLLERMKG